MTINYYKELTQNWHNKAFYEEDIFSKFIFEYLAFIAYLKVIYLRESEDRVAIQKLKKDEIIKNNYFEKIKNSESLMDSWNKIINELNRSPLGNSSYGGEVEEIKWWNC